MEIALGSVFSDPPATYALWQSHWGETEEQYRVAPLNPDIDLMTRLDERGLLRYYTISDEGKLVGHLLFVVGKDRLTQVPSAGEEFFFIMPEYRKGRNALKLLNFAIAALRAEGVKQISISSKLTSGHGIDPLLKHVGGRHVANFYVL